MAQNPRQRPTKRQKTPLGSASAPSGRASRPSRAPRGEKPAAAPRSRASRPASAPRQGGARTSAPAARPAASAPRPARAAASAPRPARAAARPASGRERRERHQRATAAKVALTAVAGVAALALVAVLALLVLRDSSVFAIESVEAEPTEHVSADDLQKLVQVPEGSTLLNVDTAAIEAALKADPWVASVSFERVFPHTLRLTVTEQTTDALVVMSSGSVAWYLGDAGSWIQPTKVSPAEDQSVADAALAVALEEGVLLITDVPTTVQPEAGAAATDESLLAVEKFREGFSEEFSAKIVSYSAPSADNVSCTLASGVKVYLGAAEDISQKESVVTSILEEQGEGQVLTVNVRVVTNPSFHPVGSDQVQAGGGVTVGSGADAGSDGASGADAGGGDATDGADAGATQDGASAGSDSAADGADA